MKIRTVAGLTDEMFFDLCQANSQLSLERDRHGNILVMASTGSDTGAYNADLNGQIWYWNRQTGAGYVFDSSTGFTLPDGAVRSPDVSWIAKDRWEKLSNAERSRFAPLTPDLVIEVRSESDSLAELQQKMEEYRENGARLGWLIDRFEKKAYVYHEDGMTETREEENLKLSGGKVLPGLEVSAGW